MSGGEGKRETRQTESKDSELSENPLLRLFGIRLPPSRSTYSTRHIPQAIHVPTPTREQLNQQEVDRQSASADAAAAAAAEVVALRQQLAAAAAPVATPVNAELESLKAENARLKQQIVQFHEETQALKLRLNQAAGSRRSSRNTSSNNVNILENRVTQLQNLLAENSKLNRETTSNLRRCKERNDGLNAEVVDLRTSLAACQGENNRLNADVVDLRTSLATCRGDNDGLNAEFVDLRTSLAACQRENVRLNAEVVDLRTSLATCQDEKRALESRVSALTTENQQLQATLTQIEQYNVNNAAAMSPVPDGQAINTIGNVFSGAENPEDGVAIPALGAADDVVGAAAGVVGAAAAAAAAVVTGAAAAPAAAVAAVAAAVSEPTAGEIVIAAVPHQMLEGGAITVAQMEAYVNNPNTPTDLRTELVGRSADNKRKNLYKRILTYLYSQPKITEIMISGEGSRGYPNRNPWNNMVGGKLRKIRTIYTKVQGRLNMGPGNLMTLYHESGADLFKNSLRF